MPKKVAVNLNEIGNSCYAVLCPSVGYLKIVWGEVQFEKNIPRASGIFNTEAEAQVALTNAIENANKEYKKELENEERDKRFGRWVPGRFFVKRSKETLDNAKRAIIVKIGVTAVS
jgi:hypothetical protein